MGELPIHYIQGLATDIMMEMITELLVHSMKEEGCNAVDNTQCQPQLLHFHAIMGCSNRFIDDHGCPMHSSATPGSQDLVEAQALRQRSRTCPLELEVHMLRYRLTPGALTSLRVPPPTWLIQSCRKGYMTTCIISCSPPGHCHAPPVSQPILEVLP